MKRWYSKRHSKKLTGVEMSRSLILKIFLVLQFSFVTGLSFAQDNLTIYLFRHAETTGEGRNPELSEAGRERAHTLFNMINEPELDGLFSTQLYRTRQTIAPFADTFHLEVQDYDYRDLGGFADSLKTLKGVYLISGHSNTTPALVSFLTGMEIAPINESEYDNLFIIKFTRGKALLTVINYPPFFEFKSSGKK